MRILNSYYSKEYILGIPDQLSIQDAIHAVMFMNSKYAYGLSGEILKLGQ